MIRHTTLLALALALAAPAAAQAPDTIAWAGAGGIYVWTGGTVVSTAHPVDGVVAHRIERRRGSGPWRAVADVSAATNQAALFAPLDSVTRRLVVRALGQQDEASAWRYIVAHPTADSLAAIIGDPNVRLLLGIYGVDRNVSPGDRWQYRVSDVDAAGHVSHARTGTPVAYPSTIPFPPVRTLRVQEHDSLIDVYWSIGRGPHAARSLEVWRREGHDGAFQKVDSVNFFLVVGDSVQARWRDSTVAPDHQYAYYAVPRDVFFNRGTPSDTVTAYTVPLLSLPLPDSLHAIGTENGIRVSWHYAQPERARSIRVYRSLSLDSGWVQVAELPTRDTAFTDPWMPPMRVVYYRLTVTGVRGQESPATGAALAYFKNSLAPAPPAAVLVASSAAGPVVSWAPTHDALRGYRVYRTDAPVDSVSPDQPWAVASPLLPPTDTAFVDSAALATGRTYTWVVRAISTSGVPSDFSDGAQLTTATGRPPTPTGLHGRADGSAILLAWDDMTESDPVVAGYVVFRRTDGDTAAERLTPAPVQAPHNAFRDTTAAPGQLYAYYLRAVDYMGHTSDATGAVRLRVPRSRPLPPPAARALPATRGVTVEWDPVARGTVRIYRYIRGGRPRVIAEVPAETGHHADPTAEAGQRYFYRLSIVVDGVESALGQEVSIKP
jgi:hypothetical protein